LSIAPHGSLGPLFAPFGGTPHVVSIPGAPAFFAAFPCIAPLHSAKPAFAHSHPLASQDAAVRATIRALGVNRHRFVRVDLRAGASITGGILSIGELLSFVAAGLIQD
jgi:hypothetical protein